MANVNVDEITRLGKRFVKVFYDPIPRNEDTTGAPIWCLGTRYESNPPISASSPSTSSFSTSPGSSKDSAADSQISTTPSSTDDFQQVELPPKNVETTPKVAQAASDDAGWPAAFLHDFESRIWLTYRSGFASIARPPKPNAALSFAVRLRSQLGQQDGFTSDTGWGCMIRSGQSLLANALVLSKLGRDWRTGSKPLEEREIISLFADVPKAPFSVHNFVEHGASACGKHPGEWFGPSATARCIQALTNKQESTGIRVWINGDGSDVYEDSVFRSATMRNGNFQPTLILVGIRLGIDRITPVYIEALRAALHMPQSVGIAGGRPSSSHYFVGTQGNTFFYLDPHTTRPFLPLHSTPADYADEEIASLHTRRLRAIDVTEMDPSMLIGFLIKDEEDWKVWRKGIADVAGKAIVHVADREPYLASGHGTERPGAIDEVEVLDTEEDDF
ncbi:hypothetical protein EJ08DRAFT_621120 [Tothia fuscella]|uniref:Cysteine protease n=1 Tax=Tothia fuscella TaxID=1048955 RepID=A0A9P4NFR6_9PEZI|nr:hypothetical protein EJ08DRAFT_621120 [Tothia fuscella]